MFARSCTGVNRRFNALFLSRRTKRAQFTRNSMSNSFGHQCFRAENDCWYRHKEGTGARHPQRRPAYGLLLLRFPLVLWVVSRVEITRVGGTKTRDMHDHGIVSRLRKMIDAAGL